MPLGHAVVHQDIWRTGSTVYATTKVSDTVLRRLLPRKDSMTTSAIPDSQLEGGKEV